MKVPCSRPQRSRRGQRLIEKHSQPSSGQVRRQADRTRLAWATAVSAIVSQLLLIPTIFFLLREPTPPVPPTEVEISLVDPPPPQKTQTPVAAPQQHDHPVRKQQTRQTRMMPTPPKLRPRRKRRPKPAPRTAEKPKNEPTPSRPLPRLKMVEVSNPASATPPEHVRFLSDKNRRVERETRAHVTNLVRQDPIVRPPQQAQPKATPGSRKPRIAEQRRMAVRRRHHAARGGKRSPLMSMRRPGQQPQPSVTSPPTTPTKTGTLATPQPRVQGSDGRRPQPRLSLDHRDFDRIYGQAARRDRTLARLRPSTRRGGRIGRKWNRIRSALENFTPEVRPGNQTALSTRADPFAVYIARMHRGIHKLWGFGFLADLDHKPDGDPMNDMSLWTTVEIAVKPSGRVAKAAVVRPSGFLAFDAAALDTVFTVSPFDPPPRAIRSADGNVYVHWRFHRNHRQCGTFGVDPFILTTPPKGPIDSALEEVGTAPPPRQVRRLNQRHPPRKTAAEPPRFHTSHSHAPRRTPRAETAAPTAKHSHSAQTQAAAGQIARRFIDGFRRGNAAAMAAACGVPFTSRGKQVASTGGELRAALQVLIDEATSRSASQIELMTAMQARQRNKRLPLGAQYGTGMLVGQVDLGGTPVTLFLEQRDGQWRVTGLNR